MSRPSNQTPPSVNVSGSNLSRTARRSQHSVRLRHQSVPDRTTFRLTTRSRNIVPNDGCLNFVDENDEVLLAGFGRKGKAKGDIPGVRFKVVKVSGVGLCKSPLSIILGHPRTDLIFSRVVERKEGEAKKLKLLLPNCQSTALFLVSYPSMAFLLCMYYEKDGHFRTADYEMAAKSLQPNTKPIPVIPLLVD